jgi:hypothetical protein
MDVRKVRARSDNKIHALRGEWRDSTAVAGHLNHELALVCIERPRDRIPRLRIALAPRMDEVEKPHEA